MTQSERVSEATRLCPACKGTAAACVINKIRRAHISSLAYREGGLFFGRVQDPRPRTRRRGGGSGVPRPPRRRRRPRARSLQLPCAHREEKALVRGHRREHRLHGRGMHAAPPLRNVGGHLCAAKLPKTIEKRSHLDRVFVVSLPGTLALGRVCFSSAVFFCKILHFLAHYLSLLRRAMRMHTGVDGPSDATTA